MEKVLSYQEKLSLGQRYLDGASPRDLGKLTGMSRTAIRYQLAQLGIPLRGPSAALKIRMQRDMSTLTLQERRNRVAAATAARLAKPRKDGQPKPKRLRIADLLARIRELEAGLEWFADVANWHLDGSALVMNGDDGIPIARASLMGEIEPR